MIVFECEQGTDDWHAAKCGIPSAGSFDKILTAGGKVSAQGEAYMNKLLVEIATGRPCQLFQKTEAMQRGNDLEEEAAQMYNFMNDVEVTKLGFCTDDKKQYGCSPDRLVGDRGLLEIKCPLPHNHMANLLANKVDMSYYPQMQGQMLVMGRDWCDWMSYCPDLPPVIIRVQRDNNYIMSLTAALHKFNTELDKKKQILIERGILKV